MLPTPRAPDGTDGPVTNCPSVQAICDGSAGRAPRLSEMAAGGMFGDEPGVALLPTPGTMDDREKRTTHANGNLTLQGAVVGVNPVDVERHSRAGRTVAADDGVALLPTPAAGNFNDGEDAQQWLERQAAEQRRMGMPLSVAVRLLPTPNAVDGGGGSATQSMESLEQGKRQAHLTDISRLLLLPTPNAQDGNGGGRYSSEGHQSTLPGEVRLLPTPRSSDCFGAGQHGDGGMDLRTTMALLCTPSASDGAGGKTSRSGGRIDEPLLGGQAREMASAWGKYEPAIARWQSIVGPAPAPTEPNKNGNPRLSAAFSEWLMGWPQGWVTDPAIGISRNDQLRIIGNGVCPQQAIAALHFLLAVSEVTA